MDTNFWLERWAKHEIGFHQGRTNEYLIEHWPRLQVANDVTVLVPLCGKTHDMRWLRERGHRVLGVELARAACDEFFQEWNLVPEITRQGKFERWSAGGVTILCGDFFDLQRTDIGDVGAVFDRAALIALPPAMRKAYAKKLLELLAPHTPILLVTADYDQAEMSGPPFAVDTAEIHSLFAGCKIDALASIDVSDSPDNARFRQRGITKMLERVFRIDSERP